jgi:hypothetical protein
LIRRQNSQYVSVEGCQTTAAPSLPAEPWASAGSGTPAAKIFLSVVLLLSRITGTRGWVAGTV